MSEENERGGWKESHLYLAVRDTTHDSVAYSPWVLLPLLVLALTCDVWHTYV